MSNQIEIIPTPHNAREKIVALLLAEKLPVEDLPVMLDNFFIAVDNDNIIGAIGMEQYGSFALLRSLVVNKSYRNRGVANSLMTHLEHYAASMNIDEIYLLTETAPAYFAKKDYAAISRQDVPQAVQASSEFSHVCPVSAVVMRKLL